MTDYHHTKFGLIWGKERKVTEGAESAPPQVENVLNRPGEIGLNSEPFNLSEFMDCALLISTNKSFQPPIM